MIRLQNIIFTVALALILACEMTRKEIDRWKAEYRASKDPSK